MPVDVTKALKEALSKLTAERQRIDRQAAAIQEALRAVNGANGGQRSSTARVVTRGAKRGRRRMRHEQQRVRDQARSVGGPIPEIGACVARRREHIEARDRPRRRSGADAHERLAVTPTGHE